MQRRYFIQSVLMSGAAVAGGSRLMPAIAAHSTDASGETPATRSFTLRYAPHFGMFKNSAGDGLISQIEFAADQGFTAWEDNEMKSRPIEVQEQIACTLEKRGMEMGVISALRGVWSKVNFAGNDASLREEILVAMKNIVGVARRVNTKYLTVVPGLQDPKLPEGYQFGNAVDLLRRCADIVEPAGLIMVLEPLNRQKNHPGVYLSDSSHAYALCRAVNRPSCKILFDIYHQQITNGNLTHHLNLCWDEIGYLQSGDNPGRNEPGTGEINYVNLFRTLLAKGYQGMIGLEHGNSLTGVEGEQAVIAAYRAVDPTPQAEKTGET